MKRVIWIANIIVSFSIALAVLAGAPVRAAEDKAGTIHSQPTARTGASGSGVAASASGLASEAGCRILRQGGNAVDAAVAVAFAKAVTYPIAGNLGGGGFMLIRMANGQTTAIDYRETAPAAATRDMYLDSEGEVVAEASTVGYRAAGVPGTVAGLAMAHARFGRLPWKEVIEPARQLAANGFPVSAAFVESLNKKRDLLERFPETRRIFLNEDKGHRVGARFRQPELAATLARLQRDGWREFYEGRTARLIADDMRANGGLITLEDLRHYRAVERVPLHGSYRGYELLTMPPPSSGGTVLIAMLNMLETFDLGDMQPASPEKYHLLVEVMKRAFADRAVHFGDPDFVNVPVAYLTDKRYAASRARTIAPDHATPSRRIQPARPLPPEPTETTHFSVVDAAGNAVANTYTLNTNFGSGVTVPGAGFLLNNEMDDFTSKAGVPNFFGLIQGQANAIEPRKRPLSSMTPTIVLKDGQVVLVLGSPGGPTIINTVLQVIVNVIDHRMQLDEAVAAPRIHHQWLPDHIRHEPHGLPEEVRDALAAMGHAFAPSPTRLGDVQAVGLDATTGTRRGVSDPRSADGQAISENCGG